MFSKKVILKINESNHSQDTILIGNSIFSKFQLLKALFQTYPTKRAFYKGQDFNINIPSNPNDPNSSKLSISLTLENDIIYRASVGSQKKEPHVIFKPVYINGVRTIKPHIIYKPVPSEDDQPRYSVFSSKISIRNKNDALGKGSMGKVFPVMGTLAPEDDEWIFKTHKERVLKVQEFQFDKDLEYIEDEVDFLLMTQHLHAKGLEQEDHKAFITQARGKIDLFKFLKQEQSEAIPPLEIHKRYQLSINILRALKEQIHDRGLVSMDIKPDNILIDPETLEVKIIDLGLARTIINQVKGGYGGTPAWAAPEIIPEQTASGKIQYDEVDERADVFSVGIVLAELWGKPFDSRSVNDILGSRKFSQDVKLDELFTPPHFNDLDHKHKADITNLITGFLQTNKEDRTHLEDAIIKFENSFLEYEISSKNIEENLRREIKTANTLAHGLREKLKQLSDPQEYIIEDLEQAIQSARAKLNKTEAEIKSLDEAERAYTKLMAVTVKFQQLTGMAQNQDQKLTKELTDALKNSHQKLKNLNEKFSNAPSFFEKISKEFDSALADMPEQPSIVQHFINTLGIVCLNDLTNKKELTKKDLQEKVKQITDTAMDYMNRLLAMSELLEHHKENFQDPKQKNMANFINKILNKYAAKSLTLDRLNTLNEICKKELENLEKQVQAMPFAERKDKDNSQDKRPIQCIQDAFYDDEVKQCEVMAWYLVRSFALDSEDFKVKRSELIKGWAKKIADGQESNHLQVFIQHREHELEKEFQAFFPLFLIKNATLINEYQTKFNYLRQPAVPNPPAVNPLNSISEHAISTKTASSDYLTDAYGKLKKENSDIKVPTLRMNNDKQKKETNEKKEIIKTTSQVIIEQIQNYIKSHQKLFEAHTGLSLGSLRLYGGEKAKDIYGVIQLDGITHTLPRRVKEIYALCLEANEKNNYEGCLREIYRIAKEASQDKVWSRQKVIQDFYDLLAEAELKEGDGDQRKNKPRA